MAPSKRNKTRLQDMIETLATSLPNVNATNQANEAAPEAKETPSSRKRHLNLLTLPAEIRDRIHEFALYHEANAGIIAPCPIPNSSGITTISINGVWQEVIRPDQGKLRPEEMMPFLEQAAAANLVTPNEIGRNRPGY